MYKIKTRECSINDLDLIINLKMLSMKWYIDKINSWNIDHQIDRTKVEINKFIDTMKIIVIDGKDMGVINFFENNNEFYIGLILLHPEYQGKGIGTEFIKKCICVAKKENKVIKLSTYKHNPAKHLYKRLGFKEYKKDDTHVYMCIDFNKNFRKED